MPTTAVWQLRSEARFRALLSLTLLGGFLSIGFVLVAFVASFAYPEDAIAQPTTLTTAGQAESYEVGLPRFFKQSQAKFWVVRQPDDSFVAFSAIDTHHSRCEVGWRSPFAASDAVRQGADRGVFKTSSAGACPGSTYAIDGTRLFGPSPCNLSRYPVTASPTGIIVVDVSKNALVGMPDATYRIRCF